MLKTKSKGANFLVQGSILAMASILSRIIGLIYRVPMQNTLGTYGTSYYSSAYEVYSILLIISSYSLPLAVSKMVSAQVAKGNRRMAYQIFKGAFAFACASGLLFSLIVFFGADFFAGVVLGRAESAIALRVLAPALLIVAILGVIRGFFQGLGTMMPSAISQIIEQIVNAVVSVAGAVVLFSYGLKIEGVLGNKSHASGVYGAAGGTLGTTLGALAGLIFMIFVFLMYLKVLKKQIKKEKMSVLEPIKDTMKTLILTIVPVLLSTTIYNISGFIDSGLFSHVAASLGCAKDDRDAMWGVYTGEYKLMINVPISIASALAASTVPALTAAFQLKDMNLVRKQINAGMRFIMVIAFPCAVGLAVLSRPVFLILFPKFAENIDMACNMMYMGSIAVVFYCMSTLSNGLLQGINKMKEPVINAAISLVIHLILLVAFMLFFKWNIYAVVMSNVLFAFMMCALNARSLAIYSGYKQEWLKTFIIPAICSLIMGLATYIVYQGLYAVLPKNSACMLIAMCLAMIIAVLVYAVAILLLKGLTEDEIRKFPKGYVIVKIAKKAHLL